MIVIIGYGLTDKGALKHVYLGDDMDAAMTAVEKSGTSSQIERGFIIKDAEPVFRHVYDEQDRAARAGRDARAKEAARLAKLSEDEKAAEQAEADRISREREAAELERKAAALRAVKPAKPAAARKLTKKELAAQEKAAADKAAADNAAQEKAVVGNTTSAASVTDFVGTGTGVTAQETGIPPVSNEEGSDEDEANHFE
jgi:membrane protein involved in colicin uptake